jgi:hypothetical protein
LNEFQQTSTRPHSLDYPGLHGVCVISALIVFRQLTAAHAGELVDRDLHSKNIPLQTPDPLDSTAITFFAPVCTRSPVFFHDSDSVPAADLGFARMVLSSVSSTLGDLIVFNSSYTRHHASIPFFLMLLPHQVLPIYLPRLALQPLCWGRRRLNIWRMAYGTSVIRTKPEMPHWMCTTLTGNDFPLIRLTVTRSENTLFYSNPSLHVYFAQFAFQLQNSGPSTRCKLFRPLP